MLKFKNPADPTEAGARFTLLEDRGDRVLVADASRYWDDKIRPTAVYLKSDLEPVGADLVSDLDIVTALASAREFYRGHGHDVSPLAITHTHGVCHAAPSPYTVRICDGGGAYDFKIGPRGVSYVSRGDISRTLESVALRACSVLGITA